MAVKVRREGECFHKHTYLASCHHIGELWVLINSQAQNIITVFQIEALAG